MQISSHLFSASTLAIVSLVGSWSTAQTKDLCEGMKPPTHDELAAITPSNHVHPSVHERVQIMCEFASMMDEQYVGFEIKKMRLNTDLKAQWKDCILRESQILDDNLMLFSLRMKKCIEGFEDGHLQLMRLAQPAAFALPIRLMRAKGGIYLSAVHSQWIKTYGQNKVPDSQLGHLSPGAQILEFDGQPINEALTDFDGGMSWSSSLGHDAISAHFFTVRDFPYPTSPFARIKIRAVDGQILSYELPWLTLPIFATPDSSSALESLGLPKLSAREVTESEHGEDGRFLSEHYFPELFLAHNLISLKDYTNEVYTNFGTIYLPGKPPFCYLELKRSTNEIVYEQGHPQRFLLSFLTEFLKDCESKSLPLILDLRHNFGGTIDFPDAFQSLFKADDRLGPQLYISVRATSAVIDNLSSLKIFPKDLSKKTQAASDRGEPLSPPFLIEKPFGSKYGGYQQPIVALISPFCMSACDAIAALLKASRRAVLIGEPTMGSAFGLFNSVLQDYVYHDRLGLFAIKVPVATLGIFSANTDVSQMTYKDAITFSIENRPTQPDVNYQYTQKDLLDGGRDLIEKALTLL